MATAAASAPIVASADGTLPRDDEVKHSSSAENGAVGDGATSVQPSAENGAAGHAAPAAAADAAQCMESLSLDSSAETKPTKLFVGGLSSATGDESLRAHFEQFGEVIEAVVKFHRHTGEHRGFGFVTLRGDVDAVLSRSHTIDGVVVAPPMLARSTRPPGVDPGAALDGAAPVAAGAGAMPPKLFVGGLSHSISEEEFREYFEQFGEVQEAMIMYDHLSGAPRGFGFVTFADNDSVVNLLRIRYHHLQGRRVEVKVAVPREQMPRRGPLPVADDPTHVGGGMSGGYGHHSYAAPLPGYGADANHGMVVIPSYAFDTYAPEPVMMGMRRTMHGYGMPMRVDMGYATAAHAAAAQGVPVRAGIAPDPGIGALTTGAPQYRFSPDGGIGAGIGGAPVAGGPPGSFIAPAVYTPSPMGGYAPMMPYVPTPMPLPYGAAGPGSGWRPPSATQTSTSTQPAAEQSSEEPQAEEPPAPPATSQA